MYILKSKKLVGKIEDWQKSYIWIKSNYKIREGVTEWFDIERGMRHRALSSILFNMFVEVIVVFKMEEESKINCLKFSDNVVISLDQTAILQRMLQELKDGWEGMELK